MNWLYDLLSTLNLCSLVTLLEGWCSKISSTEVMVRWSPLLAVFLQGLLVLCKSGLLEREWVLSVSHLSEWGSCGGLESLFSLEAWLEVHPVLVGVAEFFLYCSYYIDSNVYLLWSSPCCCRLHGRWERTCYMLKNQELDKVLTWGWWDYIHGF